jgi:hypothetical protein
MALLNACRRPSLLHKRSRRELSGQCQDEKKKAYKNVGDCDAVFGHRRLRGVSRSKCAGRVPRKASYRSFTVARLRKVSADSERVARYREKPFFSTLLKPDRHSQRKELVIADIALEFAQCCSTPQPIPEGSTNANCATSTSWADRIGFRIRHLRHVAHQYISPDRCTAPALVQLIELIAIGR